MQSAELTATDKLTKKELIFLILSAAVTMTVVSTNSPLYPFNPWDDVNCFFTLGRGIIHGLVPYRDLYEQKGPLLYFIYALAALISEKSFVGVWIIEIVQASVFAIFSWKTVKLFVDTPKYTVFLIPLLLGITYSLKMFNCGGNAEELCFPLLTAALYFGLKSIEKGDGLPSDNEALICGIITGALFWIKFTFVGFMAGFCIYILIISIRYKKFLKLWSLVWRFIVGFLMLSAPIIIYFLVNKSLEYLGEAYFVNIIKYHSSGPLTGLSAVPVISFFYNPYYVFWHIIFIYPGYGIMMALSIISFFFVINRHPVKVLSFLFLTFSFAAGIVFLRLFVLYYYGYILSYVFCFTLIPVCKALNALIKLTEKSKGIISVLVCALLLTTYVISLLQNNNMYLFLQKKEYLAQYRFAETISQTDNANILTYDVMDAGFYTAAGVLPRNRYYCFQNIEKNYSPILEEQHRLINEGYYDYIITSYFCNSNWDNYEMIRNEQDIIVDFYGTKCLIGYKLYKKK